ncbi:MAG: hypothetical protein ACREQI_17005 [Candidatus Binataceae bacterium]
MPRNQPPYIHPKALKLLEEYDWPWDDYFFSFRRARRVREEPAETYRRTPSDLVTYDELDDRGLTGTNVDPHILKKGLAWLKARLSESAPADRHSSAPDAR